MDLSEAFPEFFHILLTLNRSVEDYEYIAHLRNRGVQYMCCGGPPMLSSRALSEIKPFAVFLHNTRGSQVQRGCLEPYRVIAVHHNVTRPIVKADIDWFVSDYVRSRYDTDKMPYAFTLPPTVLSTPYLTIRRPDKKPVIGRIQSDTLLHKGKIPGKFFELIKQVKGADSFIAGRDAPRKPGATPEYLSRCDIFAIWGDTKESWSRVATEANLSGIPVVARDMADGLAEQLRKSEGGILVQTEEEFVSVLQTLVDNKEMREAIGRQGKVWCMKNATLMPIRNALIDHFLKWSIDVL